MLHEIPEDDGGHASLLAVARLYYEDDLSQQQIADRLGVSRSTDFQTYRPFRSSYSKSRSTPTSVSSIGPAVAGLSSALR